MADPGTKLEIVVEDNESKSTLSVTIGNDTTLSEIRAFVQSELPNIGNFCFSNQLGATLPPQEESQLASSFLPQITVKPYTEIAMTDEPGVTKEQLKTQIHNMQKEIQDTENNIKELCYVFGQDMTEQFKELTEKEQILVLKQTELDKINQDETKLLGQGARSTARNFWKEKERTQSTDGGDESPEEQISFLEEEEVNSFNDSLLRSVTFPEGTNSKIGKIRERAESQALEQWLPSRPNASELMKRNILPTENSHPGLLERKPSSISMASNAKMIQPDSSHTWKIERDHGKGISSIPEIEFQENYDYYYMNNFSQKDHSNYVGVHPKKGPIIVSLFDQPVDGVIPGIVRSCRGDKQIFIEPSKETSALFSEGKPKTKIVQKALVALLPKVFRVAKLTKVTKNPERIVQDLLKYENLMVVKHAKFGVLYCKNGQTLEDQMYNNEHGSPLLEDFLEQIGKKIELQGWSSYSGGLDLASNTTGQYSYFNTFAGIKVMFHVSTMIPYFPKDSQQVERKRHLGNDVVVVIFCEGNTSFSPLEMKSHFNHVFVLVKPIVEADGQVNSYRVEICKRTEVPRFGPPLPKGFIIKKGAEFSNFLLSKLLNAERAAMSAPSFKLPLTRTRKQILQQIVTFDYEAGTSALQGHEALIHSVNNALSVSIKYGDITLKTVVTHSHTTGTLLANAARRLSNVSPSTHALFFDGKRLDEGTLVSSISKNRLEFTIAPKAERRDLNRNIVTVSIKTNKVCLRTDVPKSCLVSHLITRTTAKFPEGYANYAFFLDGNLLNPDKRIGDYLQNNQNWIEVEFKSLTKTKKAPTLLQRVSVIASQEKKLQKVATL